MGLGSVIEARGDVPSHLKSRFGAIAGARCVAAKLGRSSTGSELTSTTRHRGRIALALAPCDILTMFRGSSAAEHSAVNREGAGSSPAPGPTTSQYRQHA